MINIDCIALKSFFEENIDFLIGARLQKIQQPTRRDFVFTLRNNGKEKKFANSKTASYVLYAA